MTELKTLKDIKTPIGAFIGLESGNHLVVDLKELRQEAIKWVKALKSHEDGILSQADYIATIERIGAIKILNHIYNLGLKEPDFNLTEEDLK